MNYDQLSSQTKASLHTISENLIHLERLLVGVQAVGQFVEVDKLFQTLKNDLQHIGSNIDRLVSLVSSLEPHSRRSQMRFSLDQMRFQCKQFEANIQVMERKRNEKELHIKEREELLAHDFTTNAAARNDHSTVIRFDSDVQHYSRLSNVSRQLDDLLSSGSVSLDALREQGITLKGAKRRILNVLNTLGLSNTVMRLIERRNHQDKILFWVLVVVTVLLMWGIWRFFH